MERNKVLVEAGQNIVLERQLVTRRDVGDQIMVWKAGDMIPEDVDNMVSKEVIAAKNEDMKEFDEIIVPEDSDMISIKGDMLSNENMIAVENMISVKSTSGSINDITLDDCDMEEE
ncbi:unnamed protein product [Cercopithifilaria johnstoni]|uniref:Uncharacterized protein n=1 Tax=Cercopithifilaria johnstoni TaxID=2874296 RepID=A0A8J2MRJ3_9BILA|nr:unnamed protein product [Cercopithifilaria johnstoni]